MTTPYSENNQLFSDEAHLAAQNSIYPILFNVPRKLLRFTTTSLSVGEKEKILDGEMAIDRLVSVKNQWFKAEIEFTIQERFRKPEFLKYQDVTITEWNQETNVKSELFKLNAGIFLYGYFDRESKNFLDWIAFDTAHLLYRLVIKKPNIKTWRQAKKDKDKNCIIRGYNPRSHQSFLNFKFEHLEKAGLILKRKSF